MKKKEWYELLEKYNHLAEEMEFNKNMVNPEDYLKTRDEISKYLNTTYNKAISDADCCFVYLSRREPNPLLLKHKYSESRPISWLKKADKILVSLENCQPINKADMEDSYYRKVVVLRI